MKISVANFRAIKNATVYVTDRTIDGKQVPVRTTFIAGHNYAGKSSLAQAIAAVLIGEPKIYPDLIKKNVNMLVRNGEKQAMIRITDDLEQDFTMSVTWPDCVVESKGTPLNASRIVVGLESLANMSAKERMSYFSEKLNAVPTKDELRIALNDVPATLFNQIWDTIDMYGWDAAYDNRSEIGRRNKRQWQEIAGEQYGTKKADSWLPAQWEPELMNATEEQLNTDIEDAQEWYNAALKGVSLSETEYAKLKSYADNIESQKMALKEAVDAKNVALDTLRKLQRENSELIIETKLFKCPSCNTTLTYNGGDTATVVSEEAKKQNETNIARCEELSVLISKAQDDYDNKVYGIKKEEQLLKECENAVVTVASYNDNAKKDQHSLEDAESKLNKAKMRLKTFKDKIEADRLHSEITKEIAIVNTLAPTGLRQTKLHEAVGKVNTTLAKICAKTHWGVVRFDEDMNLFFMNDYGYDTPYFLCSESEQYRIRATLQIYIAIKEKAPIVLFDRFDILDAKGRNGLMNYAITTGMPTMFFMTTNHDEELNYLTSLGASVYWIEEGTSSSI